MTPVAAILTFRDNGATRAMPFVDCKAARDSAVHYAEVFGECDIHYIRESARVIHSKAVPHERIPLAPEVIVS